MRSLRHTVRNMVVEFIKLEAASGVLLFVMAVIAVVVANSPWRALYEKILSLHFAVTFHGYGVDISLLHWVNDGLMVIFFLLVGMEIKRELLEGELHEFKKMLLPGIAALSGMVCPAVIYILYNWHDGYAMRGWAIPTATDIAFSLAVLALLANRVPISLKIFLTALAILDDLGAIVVIAAFYTTSLNVMAMIGVVVCFLVLIIINRLNVTRLAPYIAIGLVLWFCVLQSGVHATLAGVMLAMVIPLRDKKHKEHSPLRDFEHTIHPWVAYAILPLFALANSGVSLQGLHSSILLEAVPWGIILGLFFGKQIGIFFISLLMIKLRWARMPSGASLIELYGVSILCGIGFTMSLFIGMLSFGDSSSYATMMRLGVFVGSILSGVVGYLLLYFGSHQAVKRGKK